MRRNAGQAFRIQKAKNPRGHLGSLGLNELRISRLGASGSVPTALSLLTAQYCYMTAETWSSVLGCPFPFPRGPLFAWQSESGCGSLALALAGGRRLCGLAGWRLAGVRWRCGLVGWSFAGVRWRCGLAGWSFGGAAGALMQQAAQNRLA
jgi:hypothetical protein